MTNQNELFKRHLIDLSTQAATQNRYLYSGFLSLSEQEVFLSSKNEFASVNATLYSINDTNERKIAVFGSAEDFGYEEVPPVHVLEISPLSEKFSEELSHRDYLGAILNLGIDRSLTGDIVIRGKHAWIYVLDSIEDFLINSLTTVRHTSVKLISVRKDIPELMPRFESLRFNVASERIDVIVAAFSGESRNHITDWFSKEQVFVNGHVMTSLSYQMKPNDILVVRGIGKARYEGLDGMSKKGRLYVTLQKYV